MKRKNIGNAVVLTRLFNEANQDQIQEQTYPGKGYILTESVTYR